jgi:hypothetical protein
MVSLFGALPNVTYARILAAPPQRPPTRSPGHRHHSSGSPHPDTLGWGQTATPRAPASTQPRHRRRPPMWSAPAFPSSAYTFLPDILHGGGQGAPNTLGCTPGQVLEAAPLRSLCRSSARDPVGRSLTALLLF